jgi:sn-glycerol 3-phosphate transport system ATP-binding protein
VPAILVNNLVKSWGPSRAVDDVSFEIGDGEFVALLGPSGCGKSTTLRLIAGLEEATSGSIVIGDKDVTAAPSSQRNLSMVFQSYALFPHLDVAANITFGLSVRHVPKREIAGKLADTAEVLGLAHLLDRKPSQLSGGQQQRVALGRALIAGTKVCLLDEPLSNLDAKLRAEMRNEIRSLQRRLGIAMIFVTHDQSEAMSMADRVILMRDGRIEQAGTPQELYERPASTFVAGFIGTPPMNLLDLEVRNDRTVIAGTTDRPLDLSHGADVRLGVRPEDIRLSDDGHPAQMVDTEYFGADSILSCRIADQGLMVRVPGHVTWAAGDRIFLQWPNSAQHAFDRTTGKRV